MDDIPIGSLVAPAPSYRETMDTGEAAAVLMGMMRGNGRLYYAATDRTFWVPMRLVRSIPASVLPEDCLERLLSRLLFFLEADECGVERLGPGSLGLAVETPRLTHDMLRQLEQWLGDRLREFEVLPASMRALTLKLELASLPAAAGAGR